MVFRNAWLPIGRNPSRRIRIQLNPGEFLQQLAFIGFNHYENYWGGAYLLSGRIYNAYLLYPMLLLKRPRKFPAPTCAR